MNGEKTLKRSKSKKSSSMPFDTSDEDDDLTDEPEEIFDNNRDYEKLIQREDFINADTIHRMDANDFTMEFARTTGLKNPIIFTNQQDVLDIKIPDFTYREVLEKVPFQQRIDMFNHRTEKQQSMAVSTIVNELEKPPGQSRSGPFNMLSLECSNMEVSQFIQPPRLVRDLDWANNAFPKKEFAYRNYSKVEKYILMTMAGSYTEFHIDFGGTSVWYHVKKGEKNFFLIEPTEENLRIFEEWLSAYRAGTQTGFFGDVVQKCAVAKMCPGQTLILPAGWIHAVYTPVDSLVYGGNFLHEYSISMQMKVRDYESRTQIRKRFTYPYYEQTLWYFAAHLVEKATGRKYIRLIHSEKYNEELQKPANEKLNYCFDIQVEPEEFYDKKEGDPKQLIFDAVDDKRNDPPANFNDEFLCSMKRSLRNDLYKIRNFLQQECDKRKMRFGRVAEGIRRPRHLLEDFERLIDYVMNLDYTEPQKSLDVVKPNDSPIIVAADSTSDDNVTANLAEENVEEKLIVEMEKVEENIVTNGDHEQPTCSSDFNGGEHQEQKPKKIKSVKVEGNRPPSSAKAIQRKRKASTDRPKQKLKVEPVPKYRKGEEHVPLPSASSVQPTVDDPIFGAVPLGKKNTRQDFKKINLNGARKPSLPTNKSSVSKSPNSDLNQAYNNNSAYSTSSYNDNQYDDYYDNSYVPMPISFSAKNQSNDLPLYPNVPNSASSSNYTYNPYSFNKQNPYEQHLSISTSQFSPNQSKQYSPNKLASPIERTTSNSPYLHSPYSIQQQKSTPFAGTYNSTAYEDNNSYGRHSSSQNRQTPTIEKKTVANVQTLDQILSIVEGFDNMDED